MNNVHAVLLLFATLLSAQTPPDDSWVVVSLETVKTADVVSDGKYIVDILGLVRSVEFSNLTPRLKTTF